MKKKISKAAIAAMFASLSLSTETAVTSIEFHDLSYDSNKSFEVSIAQTAMTVRCFVPDIPSRIRADSTDKKRGLHVKDKKGELNKKDKKGELDKQDRETESSSSASSAQERV